MAYRAEIEIGVKGLRELRNLRKTVDEVNEQVNLLNDLSNQFSLPLQNIQSYDKTLRKAADSLRKVRIGTEQETEAIRDYVIAKADAASASERHNRLLDEEAKKLGLLTQKLRQYNAAAAAPTKRGAATTMAGAYLRGSFRGRSQYAGPIGPGPASARPFGPIGGPSSSVLGGQSVPVEGRIQRALQAQREELALKQALEKLEQRSIANHNQRLNLQAEYTKELRAVTQAARIGPRPAPGFDPAPAAAKARLRTAQAEIRRQTIISRTLVTTRQLSGVQKGLAKLAEAEAKARLDAARNTAQQRGELAAVARTQQRINQYARPIGQQPAATGTRPTRGILRGGGGRRFQDIATGAGFPLLFGGGPLQAVAGGVGGAFGGLGGSIAASAIVAQLEGFAQGAIKAGQAFNSTSDALAFMRENTLFSSKAIEEQAAVLEEQGKVSELAALLTEELTSKIGNNGVEAMRALGQETDETQRLWAELTGQLSLLIAGPLTDFLSLVNGFLKGVTTVQRYKILLKDLNKQDQNRIQALEDELTGQQRLKDGTAFLGPEKVLNAEMAAKLIPEVLKLQPKPTAAQSIPVTAKDLRTIKPPRGRVDRSAEKAAREEERLQQRLAKLRLETEQIAKISEFKDRIALAEANSDKITAARIKGEQRGYEISQQRLEALIGIKDQREQDAIKTKFVALQTARIRDTEREIEQIQRQRDELFSDTVENLQFQLDIATATTREEAEQLRIRQEMAGLKGKDFTEAQLAQIEAYKQSLNQAQQPLQKFITESQRALNDTEQLAVRVSQGIGDAIGSSLTNGLSSLVEGSADIKDVFAEMLKSIGQVLLKEASKMIATYIAVGIARAFAGMGSKTPDLTQSTNLPSADLFSGGLTPTPFAEGGFVDRPTNAVIGEGGEPEYVIPESKMRESMARYSRGSRGASVIPESGAGDSAASGGGTALATPIDVRYTVERINTVDYVTSDQFQRGLHSAATQGAKQGEQNTLKRLQMSGSTRRRLGM